MYIQEILVYDLDGTLSDLNSTFDFIKMYHKKKRNILRPFFVILGKIIAKIMPNHLYRRILIFTYFIGVKKNKLDSFFEKEYLNFFLNSLTELGEKVKKQDNSKNILLTGCTDIPALKIGELFGFKDTICTELYYFKGFCTGIMKVDSFADRKKKLIEDCFIKNDISFMNAKYFTDDTIGEKKLCKLFKETIYV